MPSAPYRVPLTSTRIYWPNRSNRDIRVDAVLPLGPCRVRVTLKIRRQGLSAFLGETTSASDPDQPSTIVLAAELANALSAHARGSIQHGLGARARKAVRTIRCDPGGVRMTLTVARDELRALAAWLTSDGDAHYWLRALPTLRTELIINCFPAEVIDWTRRGRPRGQHAASPQTLRAARMALWLAELLIRLAIDDEALLARIAVLLDEPFGPAATTAERKRFSVGLMLRALRPVTLDSISISEGAAPARVISHLLGSRDSDRRARLERDLLSSPRDIREAILTAWETRLLGDQEGQVARDFGLLK